MLNICADIECAAPGNYCLVDAFPTAEEQEAIQSSFARSTEATEAGTMDTTERSAPPPNATRYPTSSTMATRRWPYAFRKPKRSLKPSGIGKKSRQQRVAQRCRVRCPGRHIRQLLPRWHLPSGQRSAGSVPECASYPHYQHTSLARNLCASSTAKEATASQSVCLPCSPLAPGNSQRVAHLKATATSNGSTAASRSSAVLLCATLQTMGSLQWQSDVPLRSWMLLPTIAGHHRLGLPTLKLSTPSTVEQWRADEPVLLSLCL